MAKDGLTTRPWYRWCPRDFYTDQAVLRMTWEQRAKYRDALDMSWMHTSNPGTAHEDVWMGWLGYDLDSWAAVREVYLSAFEELNHGIWSQKRMRDEFERATEKSRKATEAGRARQRPVSVCSAGAQHPLANAIESREEEIRENLEPTTLSVGGVSLARRKGLSPTDEEWAAGFEQFWGEYPKRQKRPDAERAWAKVPLRGQQGFDQVMLGLYRWQKSDQWTRESGKYVPLAGPWLRGQQWDDEIPEVDNAR
jgi:uncharacterized protein YdaU (DUF1376 family)